MRLNSRRKCDSHPFLCTDCEWIAQRL